ncbi:MAG: hypothetical protein K9L98_03050 [Candidatus Pacebacteria bacterium]|nr:hypothetical protein [Candidatus Paceibacterota bacterium]MCF7862960.1 hypothetical protein [Candidatus Paceibacterota bacterium]
MVNNRENIPTAKSLGYKDLNSFKKPKGKNGKEKKEQEYSLADKVAIVAKIFVTLSVLNLLHLAYKNATKEIFDLNGYKYTSEQMFNIAKTQPKRFLQNIEFFKNVPELNFIEEIIESARKEPDYFMYNNEYIKEILPADKWNSLVENLLITNSYKAVENPIYKRLLDEIKEPKSKEIKVLQNIDNPKIALFLKKITKDGWTKEMVEKIITDDKLFFKALVQARSDIDVLSEEYLEIYLRDLSLRNILTVNELHDQNDQIRFASLDGISAKELYTLLVYGEEEIFTSSFNEIFSRLLENMKKENINGKDLLKQVGMNKFRIFIKECASFNRLNEYLATLNKKDSEELMTSIVKDISPIAQNLDQAIAVADIFSVVTDTRILGILQKQIKLEYEKIKVSEDARIEDEVAYRILAGMFGNKIVVEKDWFEDMVKNFGVEDISKVESKDLVNKDNINIQQYYFYNDEDGIASFYNFLNQYKNRKEWEVILEKGFVLIKSKKESKIKIEIYANYPSSGEEGSSVIEKYFHENKIEPLIAVHRGHSYYVHNTLNRINDKVKIVHLGSCGGYNTMGEILERIPDAQVISTKGTGKMSINDFLLKALNEEILTGEKIVWQKFWDKIHSKLKDDSQFKNYIPPHKNLGLIFLKTYNQELDKAYTNYWE